MAINFLRPLELPDFHRLQLADFFQRMFHGERPDWLARKAQLSYVRALQEMGNLHQVNREPFFDGGDRERRFRAAQLGITRFAMPKAYEQIILNGADQRESSDWQYPVLKICRYVEKGLAEIQGRFGSLGRDYERLLGGDQRGMLEEVALDRPVAAPLVAPPSSALRVPFNHSISIPRESQRALLLLCDDLFEDDSWLKKKAKVIAIRTFREMEALEPPSYDSREMLLLRGSARIRQLALVKAFEQGQEARVVERQLGWQYVVLRICRLFQWIRAAIELHLSDSSLRRDYFRFEGDAAFVPVSPLRLPLPEWSQDVGDRGFPPF
jgi:hypothetical protein